MDLGIYCNMCLWEKHDDGGRRIVKALKVAGKGAIDGIQCNRKEETVDALCNVVVAKLPADSLNW